MQRFSIAALMLVLAAGCAGTSPPTNFYTLESVSAPPALAALPELSLGLGPVLLPDTLDRPQIVIRKAAYSLELAELHHWAGDLKANLGRLMGHRLMALLGTERVSLYPWPRHRQLDYQVRIDVLRFDGQLGGEAQFSGTWALLDGAGRRELHLQAFSLQETAAGAQYRDLVAALSGLANRLAEQIATVVAGQVK
jgi:uncharacterized lipoprotein YmbA